MNSPWFVCKFIFLKCMKLIHPHQNSGFFLFGCLLVRTSELVDWLCFFMLQVAHRRWKLSGLHAPEVSLVVVAVLVRRRYCLGLAGKVGLDKVWLRCARRGVEDFVVVRGWWIGSGRRRVGGGEWKLFVAACKAHWAAFSRVWLLCQVCWWRWIFLWD